MNLFLVFLSGILLGAGVVWVILKRRMRELEKEGKIEQVGAYGRNVEYKLKAVNAST